MKQTKQRVLLLENIHHQATVLFERAGFAVDRLPMALTEAQLHQELPRYTVMGIRSGTKINEATINNFPNLAAVGAYCIGTDQIDLAAAQRHNLAVFNAPFQSTRSVVELAIGEMIMLARGTIEKNALLHQGIWNKSAAGAHELRGKTVGIIGYGNIGGQLSLFLEYLGMKVLFYELGKKMAMGNAVQTETLAELLKNSDIVTLHVDGRKENLHLIGEKEFQAMKPGAIFLNLSRGFVADLDALADHLANGHLAGAGVDVFPVEPKDQGERLVTRLQNLPNVILTPHIAGSTQEAQEAIAAFVTQNIIDYLRKRKEWLP